MTRTRTILYQLGYLCTPNGKDCHEVFKKTLFYCHTPWIEGKQCLPLKLEVRSVETYQAVT